MGPGHDSGYWYRTRYHELMAENQGLREALAEAHARLDVMGDYHVYIVPGANHLAEAMASLEGDETIRDGDKLRVAGTPVEFTYRSGTWEPATVLSTAGNPKLGTKGEDMPRDDHEETPVPTYHLTAQYGETEVSPIDTGGATWKVFVSPRGYFRAVHPVYGEVNGYSYDATEEKARRATSISRVKVNIPLAYVTKARDRTWQVAHTTATGIHGGNGNVLLRNIAGATSQASYGRYILPPTDEDAAEMVRLLNERDAAEKAYNELRDKYELPGRSLENLVKAEVERVKAGEPAGDDT